MNMLISIIYYKIREKKNRRGGDHTRVNATFVGSILTQGNEIYNIFMSSFW